MAVHTIVTAGRSAWLFRDGGRPVIGRALASVHFLRLRHFHFTERKFAAFQVGKSDAGQYQDE
jgi:hypothetical protein